MRIRVTGRPRRLIIERRIYPGGVKVIELSRMEVRNWRVGEREIIVTEFRGGYYIGVQGMSLDWK